MQVKSVHLYSSLSHARHIQTVSRRQAGLCIYLRNNEILIIISYYDFHGMGEHLIGLYTKRNF
jgi:hypothetical protein